MKSNNKFSEHIAVSKLHKANLSKPSMMSKAWSQQAETQPSASYTAVSEQAKHDGKQLLVYSATVWWALRN